MQEVFELIFTGIKGGYDILKGFNISAYGFSFSLWDFLLALFLLSFIVPLVVAPDSSGSFSNLTHGIFRISERNDRANDRELRNKYYEERSSYYKEQHTYYRSKINRYRELAKKK